MMSGNKNLTDNLNLGNIDQFKSILNDDDSPHLYGLPRGIDRDINKIQAKEAL